MDMSAVWEGTLVLFDLTTQWNPVLLFCGVYFAPRTKWQSLSAMALVIIVPFHRNM
jgi:hypothetical protein